MNQPSIFGATSRILRRLLWYLTAVIVALVFALPFFWMFFAAFKTPQQSIQYPPHFWPDPWTINGFIKGFRVGIFDKYLLNTIFIAVTATAGTALSSSLVAFGFARLRARGKHIWFVILISTMMIPGNVTLLPMFVLYSKIGWVNTFLPLIVPAYLGGSAFSIFLLKQFFSTLPKELCEAAKIDGSSWFGIFSRIFIPNAKPALMVVAIFALVSHWNDFFGPMIYLTDPKKYTVAVGLQFFRTQYGTAMDMAPLMAMSLVSVLPIILLFACAQKYFIQGIVTTGIK